LAAFPIRMSPTAQPVLCNQNSLHAVGYLCWFVLRFCNPHTRISSSLLPLCRVHIRTPCNLHSSFLFLPFSISFLNFYLLYFIYFYFLNFVYSFLFLGLVFLPASFFLPSRSFNLFIFLHLLFRYFHPSFLHFTGGLFFLSVIPLLVFMGLRQVVRRKLWKGNYKLY
jgi:hypothetical protein